MKLPIHYKFSSANIRSQTENLRKELIEMHSKMCDHVNKHKKKFGEMDFHGMGDLVRAKRLSSRLFWIFLLASMTGLACFMSYKLVISAVEGHTVTKIDYITPNKILYPSITICDKSGTYFLNQSKLLADNITGEIVAAILLKGPVWAIPSTLAPENPKLRSASTRKFLANWEAKNPSVTLALESFYSRYGVSCSDLFYNCRDANWQLHDCCELFKRIFHTQHGICYASDDTKMPKIEAPGLFSTLFIKFNRLHHLYMVNGSSSENEAKTLQIILDNGIDQGVWRAEDIELSEGHWKVIGLSLEKIMTKLTEKNGVSSCEQSPKLEYFYNYTFANCMWEWRLFKNPKFPLAGVCKLPILDLTALGFTTLKQNQSESQSNRYCSAEEIWEVIYKPTATTKSLFSGIAYWLAQLNVSQVNPCALPCEYYQFHYSQSDSFEFKDLSFSGFTLMIADSQYPLIREVETLEWWDYFALIGGAWGLWIGVSAVTVVQAIIYCFQVFCRCKSSSHVNNVSSTTAGMPDFKEPEKPRWETYQTQFGSQFLQEVVVTKSPTSRSETFFTQL